MYLWLVIGYIFIVLMGYFPFSLFWLVWIGIIPALVSILSIAKLWNPFSEIRNNGDWSYVVLIAIATFINGFIWEFWNMGNVWFSEIPTNPNYWKYDVR